MKWLFWAIWALLSLSLGSAVLLAVIRNPEWRNLICGNLAFHFS